MLGGGLTVQGTGLVPGSVAAVVLGALQPMPLDLSTIGLPAGATLYVTTDAVVPVATDAAGASSLDVPVPNDPLLCGVTLGAQLFQPDFALAAPIQIGSSALLRVTLGKVTPAAVPPSFR